MFLIPLRFVEVSNGLESRDNAMVLGVTTSAEVVLPNAEVKPLLEAPYDRIENQQTVRVNTENQVLGATTQNCIDNDTANRQIENYTKMLEMPLNQLQKDQVAGEMVNVAKNRCN